MRAVLIALIAMGGFAVGPLAVAEFDVLRPPGSDHTMVLMVGPIVASDAARFIDVVEPLSAASVVVSGPGGIMSEALDIGAEIRLRGFATMVLPDETCASACGGVWLSGVRRYMSESSNIGFHAAYSVRDGVAHETGIGNAELGSFFTQLGYGIDAIRFLTAALPKGLARLTPARALALGIDVFENRGREIVTPDQNPSIARLARRVSMISASAQNCGILFSEREKAALGSQLDDLIAEGHRRFGGEEFLRAVLRDRDGLEFDVGDRGVEWCVEQRSRWWRRNSAAARHYAARVSTARGPRRRRNGRSAPTCTSPAWTPLWRKSTPSQCGANDPGRTTREPRSEIGSACATVAVATAPAWKTPIVGACSPCSASARKVSRSELIPGRVRTRAARESGRRRPQGGGCDCAAPSPRHPSSSDWCR